MKPKDCIAVAKRARKLLRASKITHRQLAIVDALLWCCRSPSSGGIVISYSGLMRLCHVARATIAEALRVLERLGVLSRVRRRVRAGWQSLQATSRYVLHVPRAQSSTADYARKRSTDPVSRFSTPMRGLCRSATPHSTAIQQPRHLVLCFIR